MKITEKYLEALKTFTDYVTVSEWAQRFSEMFPDELQKANEQAANQKQDTTGLREIAARISIALHSLVADKFDVEIDNKILESLLNRLKKIY